MKKIINGLFACGLILFLFAGLVKTIFFPEEINDLENRYANKVSEFTIEDFVAGKYQKDLGNALSDQVPLSTTMKKLYNYVNSSFESSMLKLMLKNNDEQYVSYRGGLLFGEHIVYSTRNYADLIDAHNAKIENISSQAQKNEDIDFYVYYIEKDTDIHLDTNEKIGAYEYLEDKFMSYEIPFTGFRVNSYADFAKYFYKTDHHWNCYGSYKGYEDVIRLLGVEDALIPIVDEYLLDYDYSGSKANAIGAGDVFREKFPAYRYDYPEMEIMINDKRVDDYGMQEKYFTQEPLTITYGQFYGGDDAKIVFSTGNEEKENVLIIGESYDNAILKLIASHFNETHSIDYRYYETTYGRPFSFSTYVRENNIDKVLLIGNIDYFTMEEFMLED